ncbi:MAG: ornithine carbamoyltransferase [Rubrivivax sp.]
MKAIANAAAATDARCAFSAARLAAVTQRARELADAARHGSVRPSLRGKNIAVVAGIDHAADARLFVAAAKALGATVAYVRPRLLLGSSESELADTARLLGRLYDALAFQGIPQELVATLSRQAGVPVFDGIASARHPTAKLAEALEGVASADDRRCFVLQALLLDALS